MNYTIVDRPGFKIIGISIRTANANGKAMTDIGKLWEEFFSKDISGFIPNKIGNDIINLYTDYESDHTSEYLTILGHKVSSLKNIPKGMIGKDIPKSRYALFESTGKLPEVVVRTWSEIYAVPLKRNYKADFDVYGEKASDPNNAIMETFVSVD
jgi:predicted transcriptional regulator YdeE